MTFNAKKESSKTNIKLPKETIEVRRQWDDVFKLVSMNHTYKN